MVQQKMMTNHLTIKGFNWTKCKGFLFLEVVSYFFPCSCKVGFQNLLNMIRYCHLQIFQLTEKKAREIFSCHLQEGSNTWKEKQRQSSTLITLACLALISVEMHNNTLKKSREEKTNQYLWSSSVKLKRKIYRKETVKPKESRKWGNCFFSQSYCFFHTCCHKCHFHMALKPN